MSEDAKTDNPVPGIVPTDQPVVEHVEGFEHPATAPETPSEPSASPQPATPESGNRRASARYSVHWRAALVGDNVKYLGRTDNVSLSGVAIISDINLRPNQVFKIYLEIPVKLGKPPVIFQALGLVVQSMLSQEAFKIGLRFHSFEGDSENVLRKALASNAARELFDPYSS